MRCAFIEDECIPMWPQYVSSPSKDKFIKVSYCEAWVGRLMQAVKKSLMQGCDPQDKTEEKSTYTRKVCNIICREMVLER